MSIKTKINGLWKGFLRAFRRERDESLDWLEGAWNEVEPSIEDFLEEAAAAGGQLFIDTLIATIAEAATMSVPGKAKATFVKKSMLNAFKGFFDGKKEDLLNLGIQLFYSRFASKNG